MGRKRDAVLLVINCALAAYVPILATDALPNIGSRISHRNGWGPVVGMILSTACFCLLLVLTAIEGVGLTIITKRRGWRVPRGGRLALLAHASYGWVLLAALGIGAILVLQSAAGHGTLVLALLVIPALVPLLVFETLVYIGMHRMKYANPPGSERELAFEGDSPAG
jgi:hypothetical protein